MIPKIILFSFIETWCDGILMMVSMVIDSDDIVGGRIDASSGYFIVLEHSI
jgi:hypothetical protein